MKKLFFTVLGFVLLCTIVFIYSFFEDAYAHFLNGAILILVFAISAYIISKFKREQEELRKSEEKYKLLYETSNDAIMTLEPPDWKFTAGNNAAVKMFNCKDEKEFTSLGPWDVSPEKQPDGQISSEKAKTVIEKAVETGSNFFEWTHKRYKGENFPTTVLLSRIEDGKTYLQATVRDISAEKKAEEKIVQLAENTKKYLNSLIPILQKIAMGDFSESIVIPEKEDEFTELLVALNLMIDDLEESKKEVGERTQNLENAKIAAQNILHDLRIEKEALANEKAKDEALLASIGDGMIAIDPNGIIIVINKKAEELLGWNINEVIGKHYINVISLEDEKGTFVPLKDRPLTKALSFPTTTTTTTTTLYLVSKNKIKFPVSITVSPVILNNKIIGGIEVFRDITHEQEVDRAKTEFVSLASHQLRTPLASINWLTEMFLKGDFGKATAKQQESIGAVNESALRMAKLISALLNVSRLELGTFAVNPKPVIIRQTIDETLTELEPQIKEKKIKIVKDYSIKPITINADPIILKSIYQNLLTNAVRYTLPDTAITVKISKDDKNFLVAVSDQGIGIPKAEQPQIFSKLFRASNAQIMQTDGNGLGLYMVKSILDEAGGRIWFDSTVNKGTTFYVSLPLKGMQAKEGSKSLEVNKLNLKDI